MKLRLVLIAAIVTSFLCGCVSVENGAYKVIGSISVMVDNAMKGWAGYVVAGHATDLQQIQVRAVYTKYQAAMAAAEKAVWAYREGKGTKSDLESTLTVLQSVGNSLADNINLILKPQ